MRVDYESIQTLRVALFGTSADPPTTGHLGILQGLAGCFDRVAVWTADNPFKPHQTPLVHRMAMLELMIDHWRSSRAVPDRDLVQLCPELSHPRTFVTVGRAERCWPDDALTLVVGADVAQQLPTWFRAEELLQRVNVLIIPRSGHELRARDLERLQQLGARITVMALEVPAVSSTAYREGKAPTVVLPTVQAYIDREHLYPCPTPPRN